MATAKTTTTKKTAAKKATKVTKTVKKTATKAVTGKATKATKKASNTRVTSPRGAKGKGQNILETIEQKSDFASHSVGDRAIVEGNLDVEDDANPVVIMPGQYTIKIPRSSYAADVKYTGNEPVWDSEVASTMDDNQFDNFFRKSMMYYNYHYTQKDLKKVMVQWMEKHGAGIFDENKIKEFSKISDRKVTQTACNIVAAHLRGMPLKKRHVEYLIKSVDAAIELDKKGDDSILYDQVQAKSSKTNNPEVKVPTIQERLHEKTIEVLGEFEFQYDFALTTKSNFKMYEFLVENSVPQNQLSKYEDNVNRKLTELTAVLYKEDDQLVEGYKYLKTSQLRNAIKFLTDCLTGIEQYREVKRATKKLRVKKAPSKEKLVAKLNYKKDDQALRLVSVPPHTIIGAQTLWVYNTKTRKIGKYVADEHSGGLSVKGTTIIGFDEKASVCKTLRKPQEQLQTFIKSSKVKLRKFLEEIKAVETKLNGRINADTILLRADT